MLSPHQPFMKTYGCPVQRTLRESTIVGIFRLCSHLMVCGHNRNCFVSIDDYLSGINASPPTQGIRYEDCLKKVTL